MNRGLYLYARQILWTFIDVHPPQPHSHSSGRDEDYIVAFATEFSSGFDDQGQDRQDGLVRLLVDN